jgi:multidrug efflux system outer membrane protein
VTRTEIGENTPLGPIAGMGDNPANNWEFGLGASWELDVFGRVRRNREATAAGIQASIEDYRDVLVSLQAEIATTYTEVRTNQLRLEFALGNVKSQRETLEIVTAREDAGLVPLLDVTRARSNLANTEAAIPQLETALEVGRNRLAILLGMAPGALDQRLEPFVDTGDPEVEIAVALPAELLRRRPDVRRSERELAAQTARIGVATADLYPSFSLTGALTLQASEFANLGDSGHFGWSLAPGFKWALFTGGKIRGQIKAEEAITEQLLAGYEKTVLNALAEVENTLVSIRQEEIRRGLLLIAVESSQQSVELVNTQYVEGLTDFQSYLDAQRTLFDQQDAFAVSRGLVYVNLINLNRVLGGGWSLDDTDPDRPDEEGTVATNASGAPSDQTGGGDR